MSVTVTIVATYPTWGRSYLAAMLLLARAGVPVDEDAAIERVKKATTWEAVDARGQRRLLEV